MLGIAIAPGRAHARPIAPDLFCSDGYPDAILCAAEPPPCTFCHDKYTKPVAMNAYGAAVSDALASYAAPPFEDADFQQHLVQALRDVEALDSDGDGHDNLEEIEWGSYPGNASSLPGELVCPEPDEVAELDYFICHYDYRYAYRKIGVDFCGLPPSFEEIEAFQALGEADKMAALHELLDSCLDSEFWLGFDGVLWRLAHSKVRPVSSLQGFADFVFDYDLFTWTQIDDHDVRDVLVAQYLVQRTDESTPDGPKSVYQIVDSVEGQPLQPERRVGLMATAWQMLYSTMFTPLPRATAAQAYRSFLGFDIARSEGLFPVNGEPVDYDARGVDAPDCAACHSTLDPLSYPFATYNGLQSNGQLGFFMYDPNRIEANFVGEFPGMANMPEGGVVLGQPVADLLEWAQVAANHDRFFMATTADYFRLLFGEDPAPGKPELFADYEMLWQDLKQHRSVEKMLHRLIETEAYGAP